MMPSALAPLLLSLSLFSLLVRAQRRYYLWGTHNNWCKPECDEMVVDAKNPDIYCSSSYFDDLAAVKVGVGYNVKPVPRTYPANNVALRDGKGWYKVCTDVRRETVTPEKDGWYVLPWGIEMLYNPEVSGWCRVAVVSDGDQFQVSKKKGSFDSPYPAVNYPIRDGDGEYYICFHVERRILTTRRLPDKNWQLEVAGGSKHPMPVDSATGRHCCDVDLLADAGFNAADGTGASYPDPPMKVATAGFYHVCLEQRYGVLTAEQITWYIIGEEIGAWKTWTLMYHEAGRFCYDGGRLRPSTSFKVTAEQNYDSTFPADNADTRGSWEKICFDPDKKILDVDGVIVAR